MYVKKIALYVYFPRYSKTPYMYFGSRQLRVYVKDSYVLIISNLKHFKSNNDFVRFLLLQREICIMQGLVRASCVRGFLR